MDLVGWLLWAMQTYSVKIDLFWSKSVWEACDFGRVTWSYATPIPALKRPAWKHANIAHHHEQWRDSGKIKAWEVIEWYLVPTSSHDRCVEQRTCEATESECGRALIKAIWWSTTGFISLSGEDRLSLCTNRMSQEMGREFAFSLPIFQLLVQCGWWSCCPEYCFRTRTPRCHSALYIIASFLPLYPDMSVDHIICRILFELPRYWPVIIWFLHVWPCDLFRQQGRVVDLECPWSGCRIAIPGIYPAEVHRRTVRNWGNIHPQISWLAHLSYRFLLLWSNYVPVLDANHTHMMDLGHQYEWGHRIGM